jgi:hypothetical protein
MTALVNGKGACVIPVTGATLFAGGEMGSLLNPEDATLIITRAIIYVGTQSTTGGATIAIGTAADAVTSSTNLTAATALDGTDGTAFNLLANGDAADALVVWAATEYVTCTGSADSAAFVGALYLEYLHV